MDTVQEIVAVHHSTHVRFLYSLAESREINLMQKYARLCRTRMDGGSTPGCWRQSA